MRLKQSDDSSWKVLQPRRTISACVTGQVLAVDGTEAAGHCGAKQLRNQILKMLEKFIVIGRIAHIGHGISIDVEARKRRAENAKIDRIAVHLCAFLDTISKPHFPVVAPARIAFDSLNAVVLVSLNCCNHRVPGGLNHANQHSLPVVFFSLH